MQNNDGEKDEVENIHPDSKYDNWTIRSFEVKTKYEDIPQWMKMYAESSIDTHEFFKFDRFEYKDLDDWQKMLLKLYREDLRKVIRYYEDYRASLLREIMERTKKEGEQVSSDVEIANRHTVCPDQTEKPTVSLEDKRQLNSLLSLDNHLPIDNKTPPDKLSLVKASPNRLSPVGMSRGDTSPSDTSPSDTLSAGSDLLSLNKLPSPNSVKFKRFGQRRISSSRSHNQEDMLKAVADYERRISVDHPQNEESEPSTSTDATPTEANPEVKLITSSPNGEPETSTKSEDFLAEIMSNGSTESFGVLGNSEESVKEFESPKLERRKGRRKLRGKLNSSLFNTENIDHNNTYLNDFPSPQHIRSASSRHSTACTDFPSPLLMRSSSDRPASRFSVHNSRSLLRGVQQRGSSVSSCNTLDSDESVLSRDSSKRSSCRNITSPKLKVKSEPGANNVTVIPVSDKKEKKLPKFLSRAASFGRKDKNKVKMNTAADHRGLGNGANRSDARVSRREAFLTGKGEVLPKETSV